MNNIDNNCPDIRGILLTDEVDFNWICSIDPRYEEDFCKFTVNVDTNEIVVGGGVHAYAKAFLGDDEDVLYGGNIFFDDGHIEYTSTLNIDKNSDYERTNNNASARVLQDPEQIALVNSVLYDWIKF